jgi:hypothetical protein
MGGMEGSDGGGSGGKKKAPDFDGALSFRVKWKVNPAQDLQGCKA